MLKLGIFLVVAGLLTNCSHAFDTKVSAGKKLTSLENFGRAEDPSHGAETGRVKAEQLEGLLNLNMDSFHAQYHEQDPITVDYGGRHPFERRLQYEADPVDASYGDRNEMKPIRIRFLTDFLEFQRDESEIDTATFDKILEALQATEQEWSTHLSVFPINGALKITEETCFGFFTTLQSYLDNGVEDTDLAIIVYGDECEPGGLGSASACARDQFDRPLVGQTRICVNNIASVEELTDTVIHELVHVLGFSSSLFPYFRNATTGEPLTPRTATGSVAPRMVPCVNGTSQNIPFPASNTLKGFTTTPGVSGRERLHYEIVTPKVQTVARNFFDCQTLEGARLENVPTASFDCVGSHWDERYFYSHVMSAIAHERGDGQGNVLTPLTLALLEDSGWYTATYAEVGDAGYGLGLGCEFVTGDCIVNDTVPEYGEGIFCDTPTDFEDLSANPIYCDPPHTGFANCDLEDLNGVDPSSLTEDPILYFSNPDIVARFAEQYDYCPMPIFSEGLLDCTDEATDVANMLFVGEAYGANSRCVNTVIEGSNPVPACLPIECDEENFQVIMGGRVCEFDGQMHPITIQGEGAPEAMFKCPRLSLVCPDLFGCPGACSGRGVCNYSVTPPKCECFDPADSTSPLCKAPPTSPPPTPEPPTSMPGDTLAAEIGRYPGYTGPLDVSGTVTTRHNSEDNFMLIKLDLDGVEAECVNCGVHIHEGMTCDDAELVGPHFWLPLSDPDPWDISPDHAYNSTADGVSTTGFTLDAGNSYADNVGRAVVIHAQDGTRVGCGLLQPAARGAAQTLYSTIGIYPDYSGPLSVSGSIEVDFFEDGTMDFQVGSVDGLEDNCDMCGVHIHAGMSCADASLVGPHHWNPAEVALDPWFASEGSYYNSDGNGESIERSFYLDSGYDYGENLDRAVVLHAQNGTRIGCGVLKDTESSGLTTVPLADFEVTFTAVAVNGLVLNSVLSQYLFDSLKAEFSNLDEIVLAEASGRRRDLQAMIAVSYSASAVFEEPAPDSIEVIASQREALADIEEVQSAINADPNTGTDIVIGSVEVGNGPVPTESPTNEGTDSNTGIIVGSVIGIAALALLVGSIWFYRRRKKRREKNSFLPSTTELKSIEAIARERNGTKESIVRRPSAGLAQLRV